MAESAGRAESVDGAPLELAGATVLVCGARFAGQTAARALLSRGARVLICDRVEPAGLAEMLSAGAQFVGAIERVPATVDLVVTSPGWRREHPLLVDALARGLEVLGEVEFAWRLREPGAAPWLVVTGTNGKTTTVRMLESILLAAGLHALAVGNVGVSVIDAVCAAQPYDVLAVEASSFQLYWSSTITPLAGALLNLAPDHLDWHGSMADYVETKTRVWAGDTAIGNADDPQVSRLLAGSGAPHRIEFTLGAPGPGQLGVRDGVLVDRANGAANDERATADGVDLIEAAQIKPAGAHNVANALAAAALARAHGVAPEAIARGLRSFVPDPHRNQLLFTVGGVGYVDDSKATNPHAALASLRAYERVVWIAGGQLKDAPVEELVATVAPRLAGVVLLGTDRAQLVAALRRHAPDVPVIEVASTDDRAMTEVVGAAAGLARPGDTVLLAPAAASYDMFTGYPARGAAFEAAARALAFP
jgi:UDP-N-acetylmuramoylalanine--D-glutamate ligase